MTLRDVDWEQRVDWDVLRAFRRQRLKEEMQRADLQGLLLTKLDSIRYAISFRPVMSLWFHGTRYVLLVTADGTVRFLVASGDFQRVQKTMPWLAPKDVTPFPLAMSAGVGLVRDAIGELGLGGGRIGIDLAPYSLLEPLLETPNGTRFVDAQPVMDRARARKHEEEVKVLRQAAQVADIGMETALGMLRPGVREEEVAAGASHAMLIAGAEEVTHRPLVESGPHSWLGYRFPTDRRIQAEEMVYLDCGSAIINGYVGDIARVAIVGKASERQRDLHKAIVEMLLAGTAELRPGNAVSQVVEAVRGAVAGTAFEEMTYFGIIGHGIGTDMHEPPVIGDRAAADHDETAVLEANMVVCLEPGILVPGIGGGHIENMIVVTESGPETLNRTTLEATL